MFRRSLILLFVLGLFIACTPPTSPTPLLPVPTITPTTDEVLPWDWYTVYFTDPDNPDAGSFRGGPDGALADAIREARLSIDAAIYHLNLWSVRDALLAAHSAGVRVRVVIESDNLDEVEAQELIDAGIEVLGDRRESLMHNKFVIIDGAEVWTGSMNFTINGAYRNNNNLIRVRSTRLAENFTAEFEEMFIRDMFGDRIIRNTPHPGLSVDGTRIETFFSPDDGTAARILELIQEAEESLYFMMFSFTSDDIADALLQKAGEGVVVSGVFEESQYYSNRGTEFDRLVAAGLDVRLDGNERNMHHKILIIDEKIVILGSYNFSSSAEKRNDENTLVIHNPEAAALYLLEFERVLGKAPRNP